MTKDRRVLSAAQLGICIQRILIASGPQVVDLRTDGEPQLSPTFYSYLPSCVQQNAGVDVGKLDDRVCAISISS